MINKYDTRTAQNFISSIKSGLYIAEKNPSRKVISKYLKVEIALLKALDELDGLNELIGKDKVRDE